jgi:hypothetical protein
VQISFDIRPCQRDGRPDRLVMSLLGFGMLMAALCCTAGVVGSGASGSIQSPAPSTTTQPGFADSCEIDLPPRGNWREQRSAAMIERLEKCDAGPPGTSPPTCFSERL